MLADATQHSLVLLDELGKGTEVSAGAAIAGALVEALDRLACKARPRLPAARRLPLQTPQFLYLRTQSVGLHSRSLGPLLRMSA